MIFIPETMFQPSRMRKFFFMDELLSTLTTEPIQQVDHNLDEAVSFSIKPITLSLVQDFSVNSVHVSSRKPVWYRFSIS
jgi:hypothetical protein